MAIVRMWGGHVPDDKADGFERYLLATGVTEARGIEGFLDATVLRRASDGRVHFTLLTTWTDEAAVARFAGEDIDTARLYPGDARFELVPDPHVTHHELVSWI